MDRCVGDDEGRQSNDRFFPDIYKNKKKIVIIISGSSNNITTPELIQAPPSKGLNTAPFSRKERTSSYPSTRLFHSNKNGFWTLFLLIVKFLKHSHLTPPLSAAQHHFKSLQLFSQSCDLSCEKQRFVSSTSTKKRTKKRKKERMQSGEKHAVSQTKARYNDAVTNKGYYTLR